MKQPITLSSKKLDFWDFEKFVQSFAQCDFCGEKYLGWDLEDVVEYIAKDWVINPETEKIFCPICGLNGEKR